jgi:nucleotide-binding universal stress UspA family protein
MIYLAYDGSVNGDWISRYAIRIASHSSEKSLLLLHVLSESLLSDELSEKINAVERECRNAGVNFQSTILPLKEDIFRTLVGAIPESPESLCICGTRIRSKRKGFLAGTVSRRLLQHNRFRVLAIRVVQPGLLGSPEELLFPLSGHPRGFRTALGFLSLFMPDVEKVHILRIMKVGSFLFRHISPTRARSLKKRGLLYVKQAMEEIQHEFGTDAFHLDYRVILSDDWSREILIHASKLSARMILLGASERSLPSRFLYGNTMEYILRESPCDVGIYRGV